MKNLPIWIAVVAFFVAGSSTGWAGSVTIPNTFVSGTKAVAADVNANFSAVGTAVNGNATDITTNAGNIATNTGNIATNTGNIATNTGNIATNTGNIATNTGNIATNTADILNLQGGAPSASCSGTGTGDEMVRVGPLCVDKYEASVWDNQTAGNRIANPDTACAATGRDCTGTFARSVANVPPAGNLTWFQAQQACANAGKRLPTNSEWQMAAAGTGTYPTSGGSAGINPECNVSSGTLANTGANASCVSNHGVFDMVGNLAEWVADWVLAGPNWSPSGGAPTDTTNVTYGFDGMFGVNAPNTQGSGAPGVGESGFPAAIYRGGDFGDTFAAGEFMYSALRGPGAANANIGFRCVR